MDTINKSKSMTNSTALDNISDFTQSKKLHNNFFTNYSNYGINSYSNSHKSKNSPRQLVSSVQISYQCFLFFDNYHNIPQPD